MSPITNQPFYLEIHNKTNKKTKLVLRMIDPIIYTSELPHTYKTLKGALPTILKSKCYNSEKLPFHKEVKNTELGHLFEHIILEYLCDAKIEKGAKRATFSGHTDWNWQKDLRGTFHITLNIKNHDMHLLDTAIEKTLEVFHLIIGSRSLARETGPTATMGPIRPTSWRT